MATDTRLRSALLISAAVHAALLFNAATRGSAAGEAAALSGDPAKVQPLAVSLRREAAAERPAPAVRSDPAPIAATAADSGAQGTAAGSPLVLIAVDPGYPGAALAQGLSATVEVQAVVDEWGRVEQARIVEASVADVFDRSALAAVRATRFVPATAAGKPVKSSYRAVIVFNID